MRRGLTIAIAGLAASLALEASGTASVNALVVGEVMGCGGPGPGHCSLQDHAVVSALNANHRVIVRESITNGHFSFLLRPGKYMLRAHNSSGRAKRAVTAKANRTAHTNIVFPFK